MGKGTKGDPWQLTTAPGTSTYTMWRDEDGDPPALVSQVGSTTLKHRLAAVEDLHRWMLDQGDQVASAPPTSRRIRPLTPSRRSAAPRTTRSAAGTGCARATAAGSACTSRHCSSNGGLAELTHEKRNNRVRAVQA